MTSISRIITTAVAMTVGLFVLADIFASQWPGDILGIKGLKEVVNEAGSLLVSWGAIVIAFALLLGFINVFNVHLERLRTRKPGAIYSLVLLISTLVTLGVGFASGGPNSSGSRFIFDFILHPLEATFFALIAIFMVTAAFRAFRVRNLETLLLVLFTVIVLLGQVPLGIYLWSELPVIKDWILDVPTLAGVRGILLGIALGTIATGLRVLIGADRPYTD